MTKTPKPEPLFATSKDGTRIAYDKLGAGPPLLIVNGAMSVRTFSFAQKMADALAKHFTVYNYDRRGRGDSGDTKPYAVEKEIEDVAALAKAAGGKPFVFGLSSGAGLALEAAAAGVPMAGLFAYEPPYINALPGERADPQYQANLDAYIAKGQRDEAVAYFMRFVGVPGFAVAIMKLLPMWKVMRSVAHTLPYDARIMGSFDVPAQRFGAIKVPLIAAAGSKTTPGLKAGAQKVAAAVPGAQFRLLDKQTHGLKPAAAAQALVEAFARQPLPLPPVRKA
jgi:pimeloyl-ACP methyl ester carboxylesterase